MCERVDSGRRRSIDASAWLDLSSLGELFILFFYRRKFYLLYRFDHVEGDENFVDGGRLSIVVIFIIFLSFENFGNSYKR